MFCHNCGKEIQELAKFCPYCGKVTSIVAHITGDVLPCPHCGSTNITKMEKPSMAASYMAYGAVFLFLYYVIPIIFKSFYLRIIVVLIFVIYALSDYVKTKSVLKEWDDSKWILKCNTCKKSFKIDPPDGSQIITNIKSQYD